MAAVPSRSIGAATAMGVCQQGDRAKGYDSGVSEEGCDQGGGPSEEGDVLIPGVGPAVLLVEQELWGGWQVIDQERVHWQEVATHWIRIGRLDWDWKRREGGRVVLIPCWNEKNGVISLLPTSKAYNTYIAMANKP
jgi:hypothetical protein